MDKLVDFSQPIEAYHRDGRVVAGTCGPADEDGDREFSERLDGYMRLFRPDGEGWISEQWRIRNTAKPSTPSNEELTQRMEIASELYDRLVHLAHDMCEAGSVFSYSDRLRLLFEEARALAAEIPKPVDPIDPDWAEAEAVAYECESDGEDLPRTIAFRAIKHGRTLAAEGTAHE